MKSNKDIVVVAGTNRAQSLSAQLAEYYVTLLHQYDSKARVLALTDLPVHFIATALYQYNGQDPAFNRLREVVEAAQKYVFVVPEYNGSFPGVLKAFIDGLKFPGTFTGKKCAIVGVSQGTQGGTLAMSHLTDIFHYLGMHVYPLKPRLSGIQDRQLATVLANPHYVQLLEEQARGVVHY